MVWRMRVFVLVWLVASGVPASAQGFPRNVPGITVTGRATLIAHADLMYVSVFLASTQTAPDDIDDASAAMVAALRGLGASNVTSHYAAYLDAASAKQRSVSATIYNPTTAALSDAALTASDTVKRYPGTVLQTVTAALGLARCADVEGRLQIAAINDARARAGRLAKAAGVDLGAPSIITPGGLTNYAFPCSLRREIPRARAATNPLPTDGRVEFGLYVDVTYPIKPRKASPT